jgi:hypothetical protein
LNRAHLSGKRFGLSFEAAAPVEPHPNRTDIACFVGCVARRRIVSQAGTQPLPALLARWLEDNGWARIAGGDLAARRVDLGTATALRGSLLDAIDEAGDPLHERSRMVEFWRRLTTLQVNRLLAQCRSTTPLTTALLDELRGRGFAPRRLLGTDEVRAWQRVQALLNLPVRLESFEQFHQLFAWEQRPVLDRSQLDPDDPLLAAPLGAAVRAFFAEGGRTCYVVRTGDPVPLFDAAEARMAAFAGDGRRPGSANEADAATRAAVVPGIGAEVRRTGSGESFAAAAELQFEPVPTDASLWQGIEHVYGLPDVSFVCLPDLIDACAQSIPRIRPPKDPLVLDEAFHECAEPAQREPDHPGRRLAAPQLNSLGLEIWRSCLMHALRVLANDERAFNRRDAQLIASLPLVGEGRNMPAAEDWMQWMKDHGWLTETRSGEPPLIEARLQLGYPWLRTRNSDDCQGGVEAPEGTLVGVLARSALLQGSFRLAANQPVHRAVSMMPALDLIRATQHTVLTPVGDLSLAERVCLIAPSQRGFELMSDVTCAGEPLLRPGSVRRLINVVAHAARALGEEHAFEPNGEALWAEIRARLSDLGRLLADAGALAADAATAFVVRCGRDTMSQTDIDSGRVLAHIELAPAQPVTRISVVLALRDAEPLASVRRAA